MRDLVVSLVQADLHWQDAAANLDAFAAKLEQVPSQTDIIFLPEMFTTGFTMQAEAFAEPMEGAAMQWMREKAAKHNAIITGSLIISEDGNYYNRLVWMLPDGSYQTYDKRHLFRLANEQDTYTMGKAQKLWQVEDWLFMPQVCYDLRFPVWSRNTQDYHVLFYVANWPERRNHAWKSLLVARAIENQCYVIGLNRVGMDGNDINHSGDSAVINFAGETLVSRSNEAGILTTTLSMEELLAFKERFQFYRDRDVFEIKS